MVKKTKKPVKKTGGKKYSTLVNFILDKSGSMETVRESTISGFNEYLNTLKKDGNTYNFSLTLFDTTIERPYINESIKGIKDLNATSYRPAGSTALYDAVCSTINKVEQTVKKDQKVLTVIMTDGEENSSKEYTQEQLKKKIVALEKAGNWTFVFLGANQDAWANAQKMGMQQMNTATFVASDIGIARSMSMLASNTAFLASSGSSSTNTFFSTTDQTDLSGAGASSHTITSTSVDPAVSKHFSGLGKRSWEARKKKIL